VHDPERARLGRPPPREDARDDEQRSRGITFSVAGEAATRLFPFDLVPRIVPPRTGGG
jgi:carboxylate-amine ligase